MFYAPSAGADLRGQLRGEHLAFAIGKEGKVLVIF